MSEKKTRILVVTSTFPRWVNDTEPSFVFDLCVYLRARGMEVDVIAPHTQGAKKHEILEGINVIRYQYFLAGMQKLAYSGGIMANLKDNPFNYLLVPFFLLFQALALFNSLRSRNYQLLHAHWLIPQGIICAFTAYLSGRKFPRLICTSHGGDLYGLDMPLFRFVKKWTVKKCEQLCVVSNAMKIKAIDLGIPEQKISVMPMGVNLETEFIPSTDIVRKNNRLIFVGRLVEKKGVFCLLDAMVNVISLYPDAELLIVGDGPLSSSLKRHAKNLGLEKNVHFNGSVQHDRLPELYSSSSIAIVPSIIAVSGDQEGLGLVIIEALGCHCAVVASSLEAINDVLDNDSGCLVKPGDANDLADKICLLLGNSELRIRLAEKGRRNVIARFDRRVTGDRYFRLIANGQ